MDPERSERDGWNAHVIKLDDGTSPPLLPLVSTAGNDAACPSVVDNCTLPGDEGAGQGFLWHGRPDACKNCAYNRIE